MLKGGLHKRLTSRRTHSHQHNLGVFKISLAEVTYVIQGSQIGDWELANKNLALSNDKDGLHEITHPLGSK
jgi:hypothetical protein